LYDFYTGKFIGNGETIEITPILEKIPLFVKDGAIIPMIPKIRQTKEWDDLPLTIRIYGEADGEFCIYDDDGKTFDYQNSKYTMKKISIKNGNTSIVTIHESGIWSYNDIIWKQMKW
jgi:alpha-glucosidase (family GH31 glycosyl hydrolase)